MKYLHKNGRYESSDLLKVSEYKALIDKTTKVFDETIQNNIVPEPMAQKLKNDAFIFSGLKTHAQLLEASTLLMDKEGKIRSFEQFTQDFNKINQNYNQHYLEAEWQFAISSSQSVANWAKINPEGRYNLQYRTANDDRVRDNHRTLQDTTLPPDDPFWMLYYPPNGWRCRCTVVEVLKSKYEVSDPQKALEQGEKATTQIGANGKNKLEIFRFNPGAEQKLFPPKHPYNKVKGAEEVKKVLEKDINKTIKTIDLNKLIKGELPTNKEIKNILIEYASTFREDFRGGLENVKFTKTANYMMQHSMSYRPYTNEWVGGSTISFSTNTFRNGFNPAEELRNALGNIKIGNKLTFNQEYAMESLWHEILHAKTKTQPVKLNSIEVRNMETVNQFVARHTYHTFIEKLGGKANNQQDILEKGYGYSSWIDSFRNDLKSKNISEQKAVDFLEPHLMNDYKTMGQKIRELFTLQQE